MILALDVGNTNLYGGVFDGDRIKARFRKTSRYECTADELGIFLKNVLRENKIETEKITDISITSVVPSINHSLKNACMNYFGLVPFFLSAGARTKLKIKYKNPLEVGADRIANAIAGMKLYPDKNLIIIDLGTATTFCVLNSSREYLGGTILPGLRISMEALENNTAKLPAVEIIETPDVVGRSTVESIQAGLYFGHLEMLRGISSRIRNEYFKNQEMLVIGTGGFWRLFEKASIFDKVEPDLVLLGTKLALEMNQEGTKNEQNHAEIKDTQSYSYRL